MARPPKMPVKDKELVVLAVLRSELSAAEAARRHGVSETSIAAWKEQFLQGGREGLERGKSQQATSRERQLEEENRELVQALGELHVRLRAAEKGGANAMTFR